MLLGNDDGDSDTPSAPVKTVDKPTARTTKRNAEPEAPSRGPVPITNRRGNFSGSEAGRFYLRGSPPHFFVTFPSRVDHILTSLLSIQLSVTVMPVLIETAESQPTKAHVVAPVEELALV
jgi:hypothetical protein